MVSAVRGRKGEGERERDRERERQSERQSVIEGFLTA